LIVVEPGTDQHEVEFGHNHPVLQIPGAGCLVAVHFDLRMGDAMLGDHVRSERRAHVLDEIGPVGEVVFFAHRRAVVADDILGERVGEVVPMLGVEGTQIAVLDQFYRCDVGEPGVVTI